MFLPSRLQHELTWPTTLEDHILITTLYALRPPFMNQFITILLTLTEIRLEGPQMVHGRSDFHLSCNEFRASRSTT